MAKARTVAKACTAAAEERRKEMKKASGRVNSLSFRPNAVSCFFPHLKVD
jgi:hypothetical protein